MKQIVDAAIVAALLATSIPGLAEDAADQLRVPPAGEPQEHEQTQGERDGQAPAQTYGAKAEKAGAR